MTVVLFHGPLSEDRSRICMKVCQDRWSYRRQNSVLKGAWRKKSSNSCFSFFTSSFFFYPVLLPSFFIFLHSKPVPSSIHSRAVCGALGGGARIETVSLWSAACGNCVSSCTVMLRACTLHARPQLSAFKACCVGERSVFTVNRTLSSVWSLFARWTLLEVRFDGPKLNVSLRLCRACLYHPVTFISNMSNDYEISYDFHRCIFQYLKLSVVGLKCWANVACGNLPGVSVTHMCSTPIRAASK